MNIIYNSMYDINNFYYFTPQYFLIKSNICFNINFFYLNFFLYDIYNLYQNSTDNFQLLENNKYLNYSYINDNFFKRLSNEDNLFWSRGYNWVRDDINLEYSFNNIIKNGKPRFFNFNKIAETTFSSNDNYWMFYSLYINNYYNLEDIFSTTLRPLGAIKYSNYFDQIKDIFYLGKSEVSNSDIASIKTLPTDGFYRKEFNYYYYNTISNILYDYKRIFYENSNFDFIYTSKFKRFISNSNLSFNSYFIDSNISEYMLKTYKELDKQFKYYLFYEIKPFEFGFNSLKTYGYFIKDNIKLEKGYQFELYNNILFDLVYETTIPSKYNYQSIINQFLIKNKDYFKENEEFFVNMSDYKHLVYGLNRYYPSINGKLIVSDYVYPELNLPNISEYKKRIQLELYNYNNIKYFSNNYTIIKNTKYYLFDLSFFNKLVNNLEYMKRYNSFSNNLSYMDYQLNHAITCSYDLTQTHYDQVKEDSLSSLERFNFKKIYYTIDPESIEDYYEFLLPEGPTLFQYLGLPYDDLIRNNYYIPVKSYIMINIEGMELDRAFSDLYYEAEEIWGDWTVAHNIENVVFESYIVESGLIDYKINDIINFDKLENNFINKYISLDENFLEMDYRDLTEYPFFGETELLIDKVGHDDEMLAYLIENVDFSRRELWFMKQYLEVEADSFAEIEESNDKLLEFYFG